MAAPKGRAADAEVRTRSVAQNRKARFEYEVLETFEAGLALRGTEVKTLRQGRVSIEEAYAKVQGGELFLVDAHIEEYTHGNRANHEPTRPRKLLLHRREIRRIEAALGQKGLTLIPLEVFFSARGYAKVRLALCRGKKTHDKRETLRRREHRREMDEVR
ncbi:MAG: SsrA-binding protein SmpB [Planctomycetes bacterium]|nr:SsrA-binding protein SmpB [Planctomycetota bacterium]